VKFDKVYDLKLITSGEERGRVMPMGAEQWFSTDGPRSTFRLRVLTSGSPKPELYYYDSNKWVAKIVSHSELYSRSPVPKH